jgi:hypothetical protein
VMAVELVLVGYAGKGFYGLCARHNRISVLFR